MKLQQINLTHEEELIVSNPRKYLFDLPKAKRPENIMIPEVWYPGVHDHIEQSTSSRISDAHLGIRAVVIHATAGSSSSGAMSVMKGHKASWHWLVPDENEDQHGKLVWACAPESRAAWHVRNSQSNSNVNGGANKVNHWSLGIEVVNQQDATGSDKFSSWQVDITAQIVRYCWAKYPNLRQVVSHAALDPDRRSDPGEIFPWDIFKSLVLDGNGLPLPASNFGKVEHMNQLSASKNIDLCCMSA